MTKRWFCCLSVGILLLSSCQTEPLTRDEIRAFEQEEGIGALSCEQLRIMSGVAEAQGDRHGEAAKGAYRDGNLGSGSLNEGAAISRYNEADKYSFEFLERC